MKYATPMYIIYKDHVEKSQVIINIFNTALELSIDRKERKVNDISYIEKDEHLCDIIGNISYCD